MERKPNIAIIGAGPSGLTLARILHQHGIPTTIFERDESQNARKTEGGSLDLSLDGGQKAIRMAGIWEEYNKLARYEAEALKLIDRHGKVYLDSTGFDTGRPEIDRTELRRILLESLPKEYIRWNHHLKRVDPDGTLHLAHTIESGFDLIVGAEGTWSKVRNVLTPIQPFYSGVTVYETLYENVDEAHPEFAALVGEGSLLVIGNETGIHQMTQRQGDRSIRTYAYIRQPETWGSDVDWHDPKAAREALLPWFNDWDPQFTQFVTATENPVLARKLYILPVGLRWPHKDNFTIIGDAAHVMTPFEGEGVNAAMRDSLELAQAIIANPTDIPQAVKNYEEIMWKIGEQKQKQTWDNMMRTLDYNGIEYLHDRLQHLMGMIKEGKMAKNGTPPNPKYSHILNTEAQILEVF
ncbi:salicylate hydroxylase, putative [Talaromyces stipitatus ATCC 10500]|uniref:Salicylate hydroxylase, putative n=1 Tax=Talaromyces stipitatus (strain ATCC 10500 / CBS 375.48 / QM 6759 / NRRL 1006) TaxID=441959 RepID=B8LVA2_TALSN|nr:salicylate hydroxylase, putative [Talaromyces stipitatus ATCC 10500]EED23152.1 salicylate hydroxylase, putative [Talaromyces stipitatus ATCC 10500]